MSQHHEDQGAHHWCQKEGLPPPSHPHRWYWGGIVPHWDTKLPQQPNPEATSSDLLLNFHCCTSETILPTLLQSDTWTIRNQKLLQKVVKTSHASSQHYSITSFYWTHLQKAQRPFLMTPTCRQFVCPPALWRALQEPLTTNTRFRNTFLSLNCLPACWTLPTSAHPMHVHAHVGHLDSWLISSRVGFEP